MSTGVLPGLRLSWKPNKSGGWKCAWRNFRANVSLMNQGSYVWSIQIQPLDGQIRRVAAGWDVVDSMIAQHCAEYVISLLARDSAP